MGGVAWTEEEDHLLRKCIEQYGEGKWHRVPLLAGLNRCRKSCRLRWLNYLRPNIRRGKFTEEEVELIIKLHKQILGNRWSLIAGQLPGRTANDVKNYWNCHLSKKLNNVNNNNNINHDKLAAAPAADHKQQMTAEKAAAVVLEVTESPWAPQLQNCISAAAAGADPTVVYEPAEPPQDAGSTSKETPSCGPCKSGFFDHGGSDDVVTVFHELEAAGRDHGDHDQDYNYKLLSCMEACGHGQDNQELQVDFELEEIKVMGEAGQSTKHKWDLDDLMTWNNLEQLWSLHSL